MVSGGKSTANTNSHTPNLLPHFLFRQRQTLLPSPPPPLYKVFFASIHPLSAAAAAAAVRKRRTTFTFSLTLSFTFTFTPAAHTLRGKEGGPVCVPKLCTCLSEDFPDTAVAAGTASLELC